MSVLTPLDPEFESRVRADFARQQLMTQLKAEIIYVTAGEVHIQMPFDGAWTQQHGFIHAGIITALVDSACGFAANTLMPAKAGVLTVEYKVNFLSPAKGDKFVAIGKALKVGRTLTVCSGEVMAVDAGVEKSIAVIQATMIAVQ